MPFNRTMKDRQQAAKNRRSILRVAGLMFVFYMLLSFFLGDMGLLRYVRMRGQKEALTGEIAALRSANAELEGRIRALRSDPDCIEGLAREQGMVKSGEIVYQYEGGK